jgi:hypothetical protein
MVRDHNTLQHRVTVIAFIGSQLAIYSRILLTDTPHNRYDSIIDTQFAPLKTVPVTDMFRVTVTRITYTAFVVIVTTNIVYMTY